ncbi:MAG TPA: ATP-binding protein [Chitinophagaceae bacterium]|mgnify:CR=1 FL=1|nr:ATP-binding protein [Chitinophagaceae bacterium]
MRYFLIIILILQTHVVSAQGIFFKDHNPDSLFAQLRTARSDIETINAWNGLANHHKFSRADSGLYYASKAIQLSHKIGYEFGELFGMAMLSLSYRTQGNNSKSFRIDLEGLKRAEKAENKLPLALFQLIHGSKYMETKEYEKALRMDRSAAQLFEKYGEYPMRTIAELDMAKVYIDRGANDSAFSYINKAVNYADKMGIKWLTSSAYSLMGVAHKAIGDLDSAIFYKKAAERAAGSVTWKSRENFAIAKLMLEAGQKDSGLVYAEKALQYAIGNRLFKYSKDISTFISSLYAETDKAKALQYAMNAVEYADSLMSLNTMSTYSDFQDFDESQRQYELELLKQKYETKNKLIIMGGGIALLLIGIFFLLRNARLKHAAKLKVEQAFEQLKSTQSQLIQSEKMASLGELTAGIAHEIQNPLNFVNNFSEVNSELIEEQKEELKKGNVTEAENLANEIAENEKKIIHHGKRADAIVKGMLQHSRTSSGQKEPTDINTLCDEYLRLAYHGLRAKDKSFNAKFETNFDKSIDKINVVPQDIGRVVLNLINNAFYAVNEKLNAERQTQNAESYEPTVIVSTKKESGRVIISVKDNGNGIPASVKEKIFQPFFTTKPTGSGTGLGLSLSYDIIKAHGGELKVETEEGKGSEFTLILTAN